MKERRGFSMKNGWGERESMNEERIERGEYEGREGAV